MNRWLLMIFPLVFFLLAGGQAGVYAADADANAARLELLTEANDFFRQAGETANKKAAEQLYRKALLRYQSLSREITNGRLYYNMGNIYFRLNDIGRAIACYRRAQQLIGDDPNLRQNLAAALARRLDNIEPGQEDKLLHTLFFWHYDLSRQTRLLLFLPFYTAFWLLAWLYWGARLKIPRWILLLCLVFVLALGASLLLDREGQRERGVIVAAEVIARRGDSTSYQPSFEDPLHAGTEFAVLDRRDSWLHIELADGRQCWIPAHEAEVI